MATEGNDMGKRQVPARGKHRALRPRRAASERPRRRAVDVKATAVAVGVEGVALAGVAAIGIAPTLSASPELLASLHYLRGTNIGGVPTEEQYLDFVKVVVDGSGVTPPDAPYKNVPYNGGFRPFSHGGFSDLTYDDSVQQGVQLLAGQQPAAGDVIFGYSQGAVAASLYKATHTGNTYILVENPSRANGGVMQRFTGITIPFIDVTFSGATPNNGDLTIDVTRQYDGWADFPRYLWNPLAVANAVMGILLIHGDTQTELTAAELEAAQASGDSDYYQYHAGSNTHYYVIKTYPIPLLMPVEGILPDSLIAALDAPLRSFIETAYDRTDYSESAPASIFEPLDLTEADDVQTARIADELESDEPESDAPESDEPEPVEHETEVEDDAGDDSAEDDDPEVRDLKDGEDEDLKSSNSLGEKPITSEGDEDATPLATATATEAGGDDADTADDTDGGDEAA